MTQHVVSLTVSVPAATIEGGGERHLEEGSRMSLICRVHGLSSDPPSYVFWYRDKTMVNYDNDKGVTVDIKHLPGRRIILSLFLVPEIPEK